MVLLRNMVGEIWSNHLLEILGGGSFQKGVFLLIWVVFIVTVVEVLVSCSLYEAVVVMAVQQRVWGSEVAILDMSSEGRGSWVRQDMRLRLGLVLAVALTLGVVVLTVVLEGTDAWKWT